jgi:hypothetical protein
MDHNLQMQPFNVESRNCELHFCSLFPAANGGYSSSSSTGRFALAKIFSATSCGTMS